MNESVRPRVSALQRKLWWAAALVVILGGAVAAASWVLVRTAQGRSWVLARVSAKTADLFDGRGSLRIGTLRELGRKRIVVEDVAIVDTAGVVVLHAERVSLSIAWRKLLNKSVDIRNLLVDGLEVRLRQDAKGSPWNIVFLIAGDSASSADSSGAGLGDDIRVGSLDVERAHISAEYPWEPHPVFTGKARDSVVVVRDSLHSLSRDESGRWFERRDVQLDFVRARDVVVADRTRKPSALVLESLSGALSDPGMIVRHVDGTLSWNSDSLLFDLGRVELPSSSGRARGTLSWNQPGPVRFDVSATADAGLSDLQWVWDVLPFAGRGSANVRMYTPEDPDDMEFVLQNLSVDAEGSSVKGRVAVTVRPADLLLHHVDLNFTPLRTDLLRRISYGAVPEDVRGTITGRLIAETGGPLSNIRIDRLNVKFSEAGHGSGGLTRESRVDLKGFVGLGAKPQVHDLEVEDFRIDLGSVQRFFARGITPDGIVAGNLSIRHGNIDGIDIPNFRIGWTDGQGNHTGIAGDATAQWKTSDPAFNARISLNPLSLVALSRLDSTLKVGSRLAGTVSVEGRMSDFAWSTHLSALEADDNVSESAAFSDSLKTALSLEGTAGIDSLGWHVESRGTAIDFDLRRWLGRGDVPVTSIEGTLAANARGLRSTDSISLMDGDLNLGVRQRSSETMPAFAARGRIALQRDRLVIDSGIVSMGGILVEASGRLPRDSTKSDTLQLSVQADSLDAARSELKRLAASVMPVDSALARSIDDFASDTLAGELTVAGFVIGNMHDAGANFAIGGRAVQVGSIRTDRVFGSLAAERLLSRAVFDGALTADEVNGIGAIRIHSATARVGPAGADGGNLTLDVGTENDARLTVRGDYQRSKGSLTVSLDSIQLAYDNVVWSSVGPAVIVSDSSRLEFRPVQLESNAGGKLVLEASLPQSGNVNGSLLLERFPVGEVGTLLAGAKPIRGTLSGNIDLKGTRSSPLINWRFSADSLGVGGYRLPSVATEGTYANTLIDGRASLADSAGGELVLTARVPADLRLIAVENRKLGDSLDGVLMANSVQLEALPIRIDGVSSQRGRVVGALTFSGPPERLRFAGTMTLSGLGAQIDELGIAPSDGRAVLQARGDSLILESMYLRSGRSQGDTVAASGVLRLPQSAPATIDLRVVAGSFEVSHQRNGTDMLVGGDLRVSGELSRPVVGGRLTIPRANIVVDPLGERVALDLTSEASLALLGVEEVPVAKSAAATLSSLGSLISVENARVDLGPDVWVQTPEARVKLGGGLNVAVTGDRLALDGQITAERGQYRLELGPVYRGFSVDSGRVRFFPNPAISPELDINATNVVRVAGGGDVPIKLHIGGNYEKPTLTLSSQDPLYASAPESEIISLLIFGAPTFALDGQSQSTVRAVTGLLLPTAGGAVEGMLQRILPGDFNTVQVSTGSSESLTSLAPTSLFGNLNLSISAGKQIGDRTYLRLNTGVCRGNNQVAMQGAELWAGIAVEYRLARGWLAQLGVDPGSAPCTRVGGTELPRMQFGFDLFRDWIF